MQFTVVLAQETNDVRNREAVEQIKKREEKVKRTTNDACGFSE